ncbi:MAG TPA: DUF4271 domain-containing protein [Cyclobacteriaceae bacterium]|nr:DUF4271 domain-containing protein [Cyclobacteriaceae bacterium]
MRFRHLTKVAFLLFAGLLLSSFATETLYVVDDLQDDWLVFDGGEYRPFAPETDSGTEAIYFQLDATRHKGDYVQIGGKYVKALFINGKLVASGDLRNATYSLDSLRNKFYSSFLSFGVYADDIYPGNLRSALVSAEKQVSSGRADVERPRTYFHDFVVSVMIFLFVLLIVIAQLTKVPLSFFFARRMFSSHESEEVQLYTRIASTTNILFYIFTSLIVGFYLMIIFRFTGDRFVTGLDYSSDTYFGTILKWGKLSTVLLVAFFIKIGLILIFSYTFGMREYLGFQVVNWMRLVMVVLGVLTIVLVVYFLSRGITESVYVAFLWGLPGVLSAWLIIFFAKVARRAGFSLFHIFSYLCATEVIPLLISVKILFH